MSFSALLKRGYLVSPDLNVEIDDEILNKLDSLKEKPIVINNDFITSLNYLPEGINWREFERSRVEFEKKKDAENYNTFIDIIKYKSDEKIKTKVDLVMESVKIEPRLKLEHNEEFMNEIIIVKEYKENIKKREVSDFVSYFKARYESLKKILINRPELKNVISINTVLNKNDNEEAAIIGLINGINTTKNGNIILDIEDLSGKIKCIISKAKKEVYEESLDLVHDQVIGIVGNGSGEVIFVNNIIWPDIPSSNVMKKFDKDCYVVFTTDLHVGSKMFLEEEFLNFIKWLNGDYGDNLQKEISKDVRYLIFGGDLVEGVGIYPGQENDLVIKDVREQYKKLSEYLSLIRKDIKIVSIGGNHDSIRLAEPQPRIDEKFAKALYDLGTVTLLTNPSTINILSSESFDGFNILMYHGSSYPFLADTVESIRINGRLDRADLIMKHNIRARHLGPTHNTIQYIPDVEEDHLVIDKIPDIYLSGHIHKTTALNYRGVTLIGAGCWTEQTEDQEKRGIVPDPAKVVVVNLRTREVQILNFKND